MSKSKGPRLENTGERMIPEFHKDSLIYGEHLTRYIAAEKLVKDKIVLDIASGSGYGTHLLAGSAKKVFGIDVDSDTIEYAKAHFAAKNIVYKIGNGESIPLPDDSVDVVVTFETIEHVPNYKKFVKEIKRVLKEEGLAVISTPNDLEFAEGNHFHLHEFTYDELVKLVKKDFAYVDSYFQGTWKYAAVGSDDVLRREGAIKIPTINLAPLKPEQYLYFFLVCSNRKITKKVEPIAAVSAHYSDRAVETRVNDLDKELRKLLSNSEEHRNHLQKEIERRDNEISVLNEQLSNIKNSKAFRAATKISSLRRRPR
jgi:2-polyprenyl-3-methyl-5-hydroxy-6-metoxy-1,4-benzoquinol methylase